MVTESGENKNMQNVFLFGALNTAPQGTYLTPLKTNFKKMQIF